jgi:hypothetical protein
LPANHWLSSLPDAALSHRENTHESARTDLKSRFARALAAHAVRVAEPNQAEWTTAMIHEQEHLPPDASALSWALGCAVVSYRGRLRAMTRLPAPLRWVALLLTFLPCLTPACWNFIYIAVGTAQGYPLSPGARLIFGSATLIGPIGLAAALWTLSSRAHRPGTRFMVVLWVLAAWAICMLRLPAQYPLLTHVTPGTEVFTILLNFVSLPALGVALLQRLDGQKSRELARAH